MEFSTHCTPIVIGTLLVNNVVMDRLLGSHPLLSASRGQNVALAMGLATACVLILSSVCSHLLDIYLLLPFGLHALRTISFVVVLTAMVLLTERLARVADPELHRMLRIFLPLIMTNCAVLAIAVQHAQSRPGLNELLIDVSSTSTGFVLVLTLLARVRERVAASDVPHPLRGPAISLITAGLASLALLGLTGL